MTCAHFVACLVTSVTYFLMFTSSTFSIYIIKLCYPPWHKAETLRKWNWFHYKISNHFSTFVRIRMSAGVFVMKFRSAYLHLHVISHFVFFNVLKQTAFKSRLIIWFDYGPHFVSFDDVCHLFRKVQMICLQCSRY